MSAQPLDDTDRRYDFDDWRACTDYPIDYDRDRYDDYIYAEQERYDAEREHEEALDLAEADYAFGEADIAPGIHVVRTSGETDPCIGCGGKVHPLDARTFDGACRECVNAPAPGRFDDDDYDEFDALLDGKPRW